jgi:hypothetical protein
MYNEDVLDLYPRVNVGAKVTVTWQRYGAVASNGWTNPSAGEDRPIPKAPMRRANRAKSASAQ